MPHLKNQNVNSQGSPKLAKAVSPKAKPTKAKKQIKEKEESEQEEEDSQEEQVMLNKAQKS